MPTQRKSARCRPRDRQSCGHWRAFRAAGDRTFGIVNGVAESDAELCDFFWSTCAHIHSNWALSTGALHPRPLEIRLVPPVGQFDHGVLIAGCGVDERRMAGVKIQSPRARAIRLRGGRLSRWTSPSKPISSMWAMMRIFGVFASGGTVPRCKNQISRVVGFRLRPRRQKVFDFFANESFVLAHAVGLHQIFQHLGLRRNTARPVIAIHRARHLARRIRESFLVLLRAFK